MTEVKLSTIRGELHFEADDKLVFTFSEPMVLENGQSIAMTWTLDGNKICDIKAELIKAVDETDRPLAGIQLIDDGGRELTVEMLPLGKLAVTAADDSELGLVVLSSEQADVLCDFLLKRRATSTQT